MGELWLVEVVDTKTGSIRLRHLTSRKYLGLIDQYACLLENLDEVKTSEGDKACSEFIMVRRKRSKAQELDFEARRNPRLGFEMSVDQTMSARGVSGKVMFYRKNFSDTRIPLPFPQPPPIEEIYPHLQETTDTKSHPIDGKHVSHVSHVSSNSGSSRQRQQQPNIFPEGEAPTPVNARESSPAPRLVEIPSPAEKETVATEEVVRSMFEAFDIDKDGYLSETEMLTFAREVCHVHPDWNFDNWWRFILYEYVEGNDSRLDFNGFMRFIEDRPNKDDICRYFLAKASSALHEEEEEEGDDPDHHREEEHNNPVNNNNNNNNNNNSQEKKDDGAPTSSRHQHHQQQQQQQQLNPPPAPATTTQPQPTPDPDEQQEEEQQQEQKKRKQKSNEPGEPPHAQNEAAIPRRPSRSRIPVALRPAQSVRGVPPRSSNSNSHSNDGSEGDAPLDSPHSATGEGFVEVSDEASPTGPTPRSALHVGAEGIEGEFSPRLPDDVTPQARPLAEAVL